MSANPKGAQVISLSIAVGIIDTFAVGLRFLARWKSQATFAIDDWFMIGSLIPFYGMLASSILRKSLSNLVDIIDSLCQLSNEVA